MRLSLFAIFLSYLFSSSGLCSDDITGVIKNIPKSIQKANHLMKAPTTDLSCNLKLVTSSKKDPQMQTLLNKQFKKIGLKSCSRASATFIDATNPNQPIYADISGEKILHGASVPKLAILAALMHQSREGDVNLDDKTKIGRKNLQTLLLMIRRSNNKKTGESQRLLKDSDKGKKATRELSQYYGLEKISAGDGFGNGNTGRYAIYVKKKDSTVVCTRSEIKKKLCRYISGKGQTASSNAVANLYLKMAQGIFPNSSLMKDILSQKNIHLPGKPNLKHFNDRFYRFINDHNRKNKDKLVAYRKSGSLPGRIYNDSIMVEVPNCFDKKGNSCRFIAVLMTEGCYKKARNGKSYHYKLLQSFYEYILKTYS
jgi:hypothetical protein